MNISSYLLIQANTKIKNCRKSNLNNEIKYMGKNNKTENVGFIGKLNSSYKGVDLS